MTTAVQRVDGNYTRGASYSDCSATWEYQIEGDALTLEAPEAMAALLAEVPTTFEGIPLKSISVKPTNNLGLWYGTVTYSFSTSGGTTPTPEDPEEYSFDTSGASVNLKRAISTVLTYGETPNIGCSVGVGPDSVAGVDVTIPQYVFGIRKVLTPDLVTSAYRKTLRDLTGSVNNSAFQEFAAGEVLFLGARGSRRGTGANDPYDITYNFSAIENKSDIPVLLYDRINNQWIGASTPKDGWDYLWTYDDKVTINKKPAVVPLGVIVSRVYPRASFAPLGL